MERVNLTPELKDGIELSRIIYGMWRLGDDDDRSTGHIRAKIDACLDQGITSFDQADIYGDYTAEALLGTALKGQSALRDRMEFITKCDIVAPCGKYADARVKHYDTSADHLRASVEASLTNMQTDRVDLLLIHRPDPLMNHIETGEALDAMVKSGKVRAVGVSNFRPWDWTLLQSAMETALVTNQIELSLTANDAFTNGDVAFMQERGIAPMAWSPLGGGSLFSDSNGELSKVMTRIADAAGCDVSSVAVAWLLKHPSRILPVLGTNTLLRIAKISEATKVEMDRQTWFELYQAARGSEVA